MIDLLNIEPHQVSTDLKGYAICIYGGPGLGKTTTALQGDKTLLIAAEKGYKTIPNTMAVDINSWSDVLTTVAQLRKPEVQELYDTIVIDTLDEFAFYAEQFVLQQNAASKPSDIPYGGFYVQIEQVFRKIFRDITQHYGLIIVAHADIKKDEESDQEDDLFYATLAINKRVKKVVVGLVDLLIFVEGDRSKPGVTIAHYLSSPKWEAKSRFPNIVPSNILSYENIVIDINDAIGGVATAKKSRQYITDAPVIDAGDFQKLKEKVDALGMNLVQTRGLSVVQDAINSILGKRITDSDIGDAAALQALLAEFESLS